MSPHKDALQQIKTKASELRQRASSANASLRRTIKTLSAKPAPDAIESSRLASFATLSKVLKQVRTNGHMEQARHAVSQVDDYEEELESIDERINAAMIEAYGNMIKRAPDAIKPELIFILDEINRERDPTLFQYEQLPRLEDIVAVPDDFFDTFRVLFERWERAREMIDDGQRKLTNLSDLLDRAALAYDEFDRFHSEGEGKCPSSASFDKKYFQRFEVEDLISLRHILFGMANLFVVGKGNEKPYSLRPSAARIVTCDLTNTQSSFPYHIYYQKTKKHIEALRKHLQRKLLLTRRGNGRFAMQLSNLMQIVKLHRAVTNALPSDFISAERETFQHICDVTAKVIVGSSKAETGNASDSDSEQLARDAQELIDLANSEMYDVHRHKIFLLEASFSRLKARGFNPYSPDGFKDQLDDEANVRFLASIVALLGDSIYARQEVMESFKLFDFPEYMMSLIPSLNFILEEEKVQEAVACGAFCDLKAIPQRQVTPLTSAPRMDYFVDFSPHQMLFLPSASSGRVSVTHDDSGLRISFHGMRIR